MRQPHCSTDIGRICAVAGGDADFLVAAFGTLGVFVVLPILLMAVRYRKTLTARSLAPLGLLLGVVYAATTPWDNLAVKWGLWGFDPERIWGIKLGYLPLEEYLFFGLQTVLVGLWARARLAREVAP